MTSFQISISPSRRVAARFIDRVRRALQKALVEESNKTGLTQSEIARRIGVHRSVINKELRGVENLTLGRVAELAWAMGRDPFFDLREKTPPAGSNQHSALGKALLTLTDDQGLNVERTQNAPKPKAERRSALELQSMQ